MGGKGVEKGEVGSLSEQIEQEYGEVLTVSGGETIKLSLSIMAGKGQIVKPHIGSET